MPSHLTYPRFADDKVIEFCVFVPVQVVFPVAALGSLQYFLFWSVTCRFYDSVNTLEIEIF